MALFKYTAFDKTNKEVAGTLEAASEKMVSLKLREMGMRPIDIAQTSEKAAAGGGLFSGKKKIKDAIVVGFTRQLATLIESGVPLLRAINILAEQSEHPAFKEILEKIFLDIQGGKSFSEALTAHPRQFEKLYISMIKAGEVGGVLETVLDRLATFKEKDLELRMKIKSALMYPAVMATVAIGVVTFLLVGVLPTFIKMFEEMGVDLPLPTRIVVGASNFLQNFWYLFVIGIPIFIIGLKKYRQTDAGLIKTDQLKLKLPIFGPLLLKTATARFTRTLGTLIQSGVPIIQALKTVRDTIGNEILAMSIDKVMDSIKEGETISGPLHAEKVFPPMVTHMMAVGEETGALDDMLVRIANQYDTIVDETVAALSSMIEPLMIVFMGGAVGTIVMALFFPMFEMVNLVH